VLLHRTRPAGDYIRRPSFRTRTIALQRKVRRAVAPRLHHGLRVCFWTEIPTHRNRHRRKAVFKNALSDRIPSVFCKGLCTTQTGRFVTPMLPVCSAKLNQRLLLVCSARVRGRSPNETNVYGGRSSYGSITDRMNSSSSLDNCRFTCLVPPPILYLPIIVSKRIEREREREED
jgi:hypothetical protein